MDSVVRSYLDAGSFAGSVLVARGSDVIISKGYGLANVEWNVPSTPDARFNVASIASAPQRTPFAPALTSSFGSA